MRSFFLVSTALAILSTAAASPFTYSQDFQGAVGSEWSTTSVSAAPADANRRFLGPFGNDSVTLTLTGLTPGLSTTIGFDLFINDSYDGAHSLYGPDTNSLSVDGTLLLNASFSNNPDGIRPQNYSAGNPLGGPLVPARTSADEVGTLGFPFIGDSVYKFGGAINPGFVIVPSSSTLVLSWSGSNQEGVTNESWGLDNVVVSQAPPVPEPASMAVLGLGLAALKRRRRTAR